MLGILQVLERIRSEASEGRGSALDDHIDLFEMMRQEDEHEMQRFRLEFCYSIPLHL